MAFDIIGRPGSVPVIFGDVEDMQQLQYVDIDARTGAVTLVLVDGARRNRQTELALSPEIAETLRTTPQVLTVAVDGKGRTVAAQFLSTDPQQRDWREAVPENQVVEMVSGLLDGKLTVEVLRRRHEVRR